MVFQNFRISEEKRLGLRLTWTGHTFLKDHYEEHYHKLDTPVSNKSLVLLDKYQVWPYYISRNSAAFYNDVDSSMFVLCNKNINEYAETLKNG